MQVALDDYVRGAVVVTDLVNTAPEVWPHKGDLLDAPAALGRFLAEHRVRYPEEPTAGDLDAVRELRGALRELLESDDAAHVAERAAELVARGGVGPALSHVVGERWDWCVRSRPDARPADLLALVTAIGLLGTLRTLGHTRFRECASPTCAGLFVDTSRAGRRRYCEPAVCGNRINVANHRARRRADPGTD
ncbi:CGNR zinc finger domain-containing protein [Pseudonocardia sp. TRM90224]|uniref:CGNR zinc finger domain-containing protein n=1 Tax=Pseudonocardia sp. TRM90224 TaxID=2812678 RepID=UPI001E2A754F|nr:CGNR zinc finger domain-containing protein [Pseudonocardia sp. TRM90224]